MEEGVRLMQDNHIRQKSSKSGANELPCMFDTGMACRQSVRPYCALSAADSAVAALHCWLGSA